MAGFGCSVTDEELDILDLSGRGIDDRRLLPRVVDEGLLPRWVDLPHGGMGLVAEALIELAEPAVAVSVGMDVAVLDPQQLKRHARTGKFPMDRSEIRLGSTRHRVTPWTPGAGVITVRRVGRSLPERE